MIFGNIYDSLFEYPPAIDVNTTRKKVLFFINDRWLEIGPIETVIEGRGTKSASVYMKFPDVGSYLEDRESLSDGTKDWVIWGPRVN